jgi:hypothetical protein
VEGQISAHIVVALLRGLILSVLVHPTLVKQAPILSLKNVAEPKEPTPHFQQQSLYKCCTQEYLQALVVTLPAGIIKTENQGRVTQYR